jgi:ribonuclease HI
MDLSIEFASIIRARDGPSACGVVITDRTTARAIHASGHDLGTQPSAQAALLAALDQALDLAGPLEPQTVELRCASELLVRQITGRSPVADVPASRFESITRKLLGLDSWRITAADAAQMHRAQALAERALAEAGPVTELNPGDAAKRQQQRHTGVPQWTVELVGEPHACPAGCCAGQRFAFGPDTPAGLCVHAAVVALTDGPMAWLSPDQQSMTTLCPHCECTIRLQRVG